MSNTLISSEYRSLLSIQKLKQALSHGIAFHHAGVLPKAKELVEKSWKEAEACITESSAKSLLREFANYVVERQS